MGSYTTWVADFSNSRCSRTILNDSGWTYVNPRYWVYNSFENNVSAFSWNSNVGSSVCHSSGLASSCFDGTYTYYRGSLVISSDSYKIYYIKRTYISTEYKAFSSF